MTKDNGGPAFPTATQVEQNQATGETTIHQYLSDGMTLRDYFAAKAMSLCDGRATESELDEWFGRGSMNISRQQITARQAYTIADAMLKARES